MLHDMYLMQVKAPAESKARWDYYKPVATLAGSDIYTSLEESTCPLVKK
jgi:branched-chain amino acid transport system substrate-binding protein